MTRPHFHRTPPQAVRSRVRDRVDILDRAFLIERPDPGEELFDHPTVQAAYAADDYIPYWSDLWPAARMLAKAILREPWPILPEGRKLAALEIACGLGLPGIAALASGLSVTFSDVDRMAIEFAATNARLNGYPEFQTCLIDLRSPPPSLSVDVLLAADLLYESRLVDAVVAFIHAVLAPHGMALLTDPDRPTARPLQTELRRAGLKVTTAFTRAGEPGGGRTKGTLYRITRA